ncbi:hypothetical protein [Flavobacterium sasangense]|uniref:hypothetical protein n=1 Tax=Flavobacterium sasangense TaxID=503361 RepID=UPI00068FC5BE|nr:hypothetical protein [Flavobacterium sasangense]
MYEYQNNVLSIPAKLLYEDWGLMAYKTYHTQCQRGKLVRTKEGRGAGNTAYISFYDLPFDIKKVCVEKLGDPKEVAVRNQLEGYIVPDSKAIQFFAEHRKPNGKPLSLEDQREKATNAMILNAIQSVLKDRSAQVKMFGRKTTAIWQNISEAVNAINTTKWSFDLPGNWRRLKKKYEDYLQDGYEVFLHKAEGLKRAQKIKGEIADFLLAQYSLPIKYSIPQLMAEYKKAQYVKEWDDLTEQAVYNWLYEPEQMRIWILARDGKDAWRNKFANSIDRDKSKWFPNVYWAIDGSKLDWIHYDDESSNKRGAKLKINPLVDVYSEKILGWSYSETESHIDHIKALNMALNTAQTRPYLLTYDKQSGHKMGRMQELYDNVVARNGGTHYSHKAGQKSNPMEQLFNRLQQQCANMWWWSDKQSIKVRSSRNKMNADFIAENTDNLLKKEDLLKAWEITVKQWNESEHPLFKGKTRDQVYYEHEMLMREELSVLEIASTVWIAETKPITYKREGLTMRLGDDKYKFEVYDYNGNIDLEFRRVNIGKKFIVRYNPEYLDAYIQLYERTNDGQMIFIAAAEPKRAHESVPVLMAEGAKEQWWKDFKTQQEELDRDQKAYNDLVARTGISREQLIADQALTIKMGGNATKKERALAEANEYDF